MYYFKKTITLGTLSEFPDTLTQAKHSKYFLLMRCAHGIVLERPLVLFSSYSSQEIHPHVPVDHMLTAN